jgi:hypothetical protein
MHWKRGGLEAAVTVAVVAGQWWLVGWKEL